MLTAPRTRGKLLIAATLLCAGACGHASENIARRATPASIEAALQALNDPENRAALAELMRNPDVREAAHQLAEAITTGVVDGVSDEQRAEKIRELSDAYVRHLAAAVGESLEAEVTPRVVELLTRSVEQTLDTALSDEVRGDAVKMVDAITRVAVSTMTETVASGLRDDIGPATREVLERDIGPALEHVIAENLGPALEKVIRENIAKAVEETLQESVKPAAGELSREVARGMVLGTNDGLQELGASPFDFSRISDKISEGLDRGEALGERIAWILALLAVVLALWLGRTYWLKRREQLRRERFEKGMLHLMTVIKGAEHEPWAHELKQRIKERAKETGDAEAVEELLRERTDLRLSKSGRDAAR